MTRCSGAQTHHFGGTNVVRIVAGNGNGKRTYPYRTRGGEGRDQEARLGSTKLRDFADVLQPYLVLRVRGYSISWLVKTRNRALKIGTPLAADAVSAGGRRQRSTASTDTLTLREARERAKREWSKLDGAAPEPPRPGTWTWSELAEKYKALISDLREDSQGRTVYPSEETLPQPRSSTTCRRDAFRRRPKPWKPGPKLC
jgi:hypothetical protein